MSALNFLFREDLIAIATDSRVSKPNSLAPLKYSTKAYPLPHARSIISGTGLQELILEWYFWILNKSKSDSIEELNREAEIKLPEIWQQLKLIHRFDDSITTTVYQFGINVNDSISGFAYRSTDGFKSELLPYGFGIKPYGKEINEATENVTFQDIIDQFKFIIRRQREIDESGLHGMPVGIGGEMILTTLTKDGFGIACFDRFEDYKEMKESFQSV